MKLFFFILTLLLTTKPMQTSEIDYKEAFFSLFEKFLILKDEVLKNDTSQQGIERYTFVKHSLDLLHIRNSQNQQIQEIDSLIGKIALQQTLEQQSNNTNINLITTLNNIKKELNLHSTHIELLFIKPFLPEKQDTLFDILQ